MSTFNLHHDEDLGVAEVLEEEYLDWLKKTYETAQKRFNQPSWLERLWMSDSEFAQWRHDQLERKSKE